MDSNIYDNFNITDFTTPALIESYGAEIKSGKIYSTTIDLQKSNVLKKYTTWIDKIADLKPIEYYAEDIELVDTKSVMNIALIIARETFGDKIDNDFFEYLKTIEITGDNSILEGLALSAAGKLPVIDTQNITYIPNLERLSSVAILLHEFMHFYCRKYKIDFNKKRYYEEILSLYIEKYTLNLLKEHSKDSEFVKKCESTRLDGIVWHYKISPIECQEIISSYNKLKKLNKKLSNELLIRQMEECFPWLKSSVMIENMKLYKKCLADSYGIGYLFADALYRRRLEDETTAKRELQKLFNKEKTLEEVLNYYNITTSNFQIYDDSYAYIKKVLK